jgi:hypothetical protein
LFAGVRISQATDREPGDKDIVEGRILEEDDDGDADYEPTKRYKYSREHRLAAIEYFQTIWKVLDDGSHQRFSKRLAAKKLKTTRQMLRDWVYNKERIKEQKRGSYRSRHRAPRAHESTIEERLNAAFEAARDKGRKISYKWMIRHARIIYAELHPDRVITHEHGKKMYLGFRFSSGWYNRFRKRYAISLRAGTKRAQKSPEELEPTIRNWIQFNRPMTVTVKGKSVVGIPRGPDIPVVGRIKLSEICNMDQSPMPFEYLKGRTYAKKGPQTVRLR